MLRVVYADIVGDGIVVAQPPQGWLPDGQLPSRPAQVATIGATRGGCALSGSPL